MQLAGPGLVPPACALPLAVPTCAAPPSAPAQPALNVVAGCAGCAQSWGQPDVFRSLLLLRLDSNRLNGTLPGSWGSGMESLLVL